MAKASSIAKNIQKKELADKYFKHRSELRAAIVNESLSDSVRYDAHLKLQKLPVNSSVSRSGNRCHLTGRPRGFLRKFGISRIAVRELAGLGKLPGVTKSSW